MSKIPVLIFPIRKDLPLAYSREIANVKSERFRTMGNTLPACGGRLATGAKLGTYRRWGVGSEAYRQNRALREHPVALFGGVRKSCFFKKQGFPCSRLSLVAEPLLQDSVFGSKHKLARKMHF